MSATPADEAAPSLAALRQAGAQRLDPVRFRYLESLSRRLEALQGEVHAQVQRRLQQGLADYAARWQQAPPPPAGEPRAARRVAAAAAPAGGQHPLAELNRYLRQRSQEAGGDPASGADDATELKSLRRFRRAWSRIAAEDQVALAAARGPQNAGPLNSHRLVLRSLALMRDLSPDYLRHFLSQVDSLLWLEQAQRRAAPAARPPRRGGARKPPKP